MKILFVCSGNNRLFTIAPFVKSQAESLVELGHSVDFYLIKGKGLKGYLKNIKPLQREIKREKYDIVHAHYSFCGWISRFATLTTPLVVSYMGSDTYGAVNFKGKRKFKSIFFAVQGALLNLFADAIIVKSENLYEKMLLKKKTTIIPNGVNFDMFKPIPLTEARKKSDLDQEKNYALFAGDPKDARKNYQLAVQTVDMINNDVSLELLTPYPVPHDKMPLLMNAVNLLISTSFLEGSPNVIKEAMACNCPVVSTPAGDAEKTVNNSENCFIVDYDPKDIAKKVLSVLKSGKRSNGRDMIPHLNNKLIAEKVLDVYKSISKRS